ncbi:MAG: hypothetical protein KAJ91_00890 [Candidatus Aenigmarchaeota archaeon]|nr:hypothetical protein [Candidatus Aenigmarchaeota archaeon]MCK5334337.1 hypothetical protein [Candidatus Aenigmarchaeota archaeon]
MKGTSNLVHIIIICVISLFVAALAITIAGSAAEDADGPVTGTMSAVDDYENNRLYCTLHCPNPPDDCDVPEDKVKMCTIIAGTPADWGPGTPGSGTEDDTKYASFEGVFVPGGTVEVTLPDSLKSKYNPSDDQEWKIYVVSGTEDIILECAMAAEEDDGDALCFFPDAEDILDDKITITLPYERNKNNIETKLKEQETYKLLLLLFEKNVDVEETSDVSSMFLYNLGQKIFDAGVGIDTVIGLEDISWSCPQPHRDGGYSPEDDVVFTFPTDGTYSWVDIENYDGQSAKIEIGIRSGGPYDLCTLDSVKATCNAVVTPAGEKYKFPLPYTEHGEEVAISYPVYAKDVNIKYTDSDGNGQNNAPMCRSGKQDYVYTCPATACHIDTDGADAGIYIVSSLEDAGENEVNPACTYSLRDEQCTIGCTMLLSNTAECSLPKSDMIDAYMAVKKGGVWTKEKVLKDTGTYELNDDFFLAWVGYDQMSVIVVIKNTATEIDNSGEPKIKAENLKFTALLDSVEVGVFPIPTKHYKSDVNEVDNAPVGDSELLPGDIFEYEVILNEDGDDLGPHTVNIELSAVGSIDLDGIIPAKISADTQISRNYLYKIYSKCCIDCSCANQDACNACDGRCKWTIVPGAERSCTMA